MMKGMAGLVLALAAIAVTGCSSSKDPRAEAAEQAAQTYVDEQAPRIARDITTMAREIRVTLGGIAPDSPEFTQSFAEQLTYRSLSEAAIVVAGPGDKRQPIATANLDQRGLGLRMPAAAIEAADKGAVYLSTETGDRLEAVAMLEPKTRAYLYVSRRIAPAILEELAKSGGVLPSPVVREPAK